MNKTSLLLMTSLVLLSACNTTIKGDAPDVKVSGDGYSVEVDDDNNNNGDFCPPGQAKKGNC